MLCYANSLSNEIMNNYFSLFLLKMKKKNIRLFKKKKVCIFIYKLEYLQSTSIWHLQTEVAAQANWTTFHRFSVFLGFASKTEFLRSHHKFSIRLRSRDWAGLFLVCNQDVTCLLVCLGSLFCWNTHFRGISFSA